MIGRGLTEKDLRALRVLKGAAHAGGFSAAERLLNMTTATISRQIKSVEERLGTKLCLRGPQGFELTKAGNVALKYAEQALDALENIYPAVKALEGTITGALKIGIVDNTISCCDFKLYQALNKLYALSSSISVSVKILPKSKLIRSLIAHNIDIAIEGLHEKIPSLDYLHLFDEPSSIYRLDNGNNGPIPMVNRPEHLISKRIFQEHNFEKGPEANSVESVAILIATGRFCGVLPKHYAEMISRNIPLRSIENSPHINVGFHAVTDPRKELPLCAQVFLDLLHTECRE